MFLVGVLFVGRGVSFRSLVMTEFLLQVWLIVQLLPTAIFIFFVGGVVLLFAVFFAVALVRYVLNKVAGKNS
jgi:hypothetical protein